MYYSTYHNPVTRAESWPKFALVETPTTKPPQLTPRPWKILRSEASWMTQWSVLITKDQLAMWFAHKWTHACTDTHTHTFHRCGQFLMKWALTQPPLNATCPTPWWLQRFKNWLLLGYSGQAKPKPIRAPMQRKFTHKTCTMELIVHKNINKNNNGGTRLLDPPINIWFRLELHKVIK